MNEIFSIRPWRDAMLWDDERNRSPGPLMLMNGNGAVGGGGILFYRVDDLHAAHNGLFVVGDHVVVTFGQ
jgi:hypothetical protein